MKDLCTVAANSVSVSGLYLTYVCLLAGVVSRTFGIMPEKAFKMQGWVLVGRFMESKFEEPTISKWLVAGAAAGAATTLIGEYNRIKAISADTRGFRCVL